MSKIVGIDLGTTNSLVAVVDSGIPLIIPNADGRRLTPSAVQLPGSGGTPVIGEAALRARSLHPGQTVTSVKRLMGRRISELSRDDRQLPYALESDHDAVRLRVGDASWSPEAVSAEILKVLKAQAEAFVEAPVSRAVITVPAYFNDAQRQATRQAGELAGFTVERIINEPTAAALAYGLNRLKEKSKVAVYDLGGGTFDLSILELSEGVFQVLSTNGNTRLGGDDIDQALVRHLTGQIASDPEGPGELDSQAQARLIEAAQAAKVRLSSEDATEINLPFLRGDFSVQHTLSRSDLETLAHPIVERTRAHCIRALGDAGLTPQDLDQVILVGGQTRMPLVRRLVSQWFECADFEELHGELRVGSDPHAADGPVLNTSQNPDEAVALGAAIQAEILAGGFKDMLLLDVTPLSLGLETFGGLMNVIIPRNSTIPVKAGEAFTTAVDNQREMLIHVLQGERERAADNWSLGRFTLQFEPAPKGVARVGVQFEIDADGILHVLARDIKTGRQQVVDLKSAVDVSDEDVQRMVEESVEHAFDDLNLRQWIETKLRAEETIQAAQRGMADFASEIDPEYSEEIEKALTTLKATLAEAERSDEPGNATVLKRQLGDLDRVTQPLAERMMEAATDEMLRRRGIID